MPAVLRLVLANAGLTLLLLACLEAGSALVLGLWAAGGPDTTTWLALSRSLPPDAYPGQDWVEDYFRGIDDQLTPRWYSYAYWRARPRSTANYTVDAAGLRRTWRPAGTAAGPPAGCRRLFVFGGSAAQGTGARDDFTIPSRLARLAAGRVPGGLLVSNFGQSGYVTTQEVITLLRELQAGERPDAVLFYDGYNDVFSAFQSGEAGLPQNEWNRAAEFLLLRPGQQRRLLQGLVRGSATARLLDALRGGPVVRPPTRTPAERAALAEAVVRAYRANLRSVAALGKEFGFDCLFSWQPTVFTRARPTAYEAGVLERDAEIGLLLEEVRSRLGAADGSDPVPLDLADVLDGSAATMFIDAVHTTENANERIAAHLLASLGPMLERSSSR